MTGAQARRRRREAERSAARERVVGELRQLGDHVDEGLALLELLEAVAWAQALARDPSLRPPWRRQAPDPPR